MPKAKQVRFAQLIKAAGKPHPTTLWTEPAKDRKFSKALQENRVLTIRNVNVGTKKDRGVIGFLKGPGSTFLIFPKALPMAEGTGVVGLRFEDVADAPVDDPVKIKGVPQKKKVEMVKKVGGKASKEADTHRKETRESRIFQFRVKVAYSATVLRDVEVQAASAATAIAAAESKAPQLPPEEVEWKAEGLEVKKVD